MSDEDKILFALAPSLDGGNPLLLLGITRAAWIHMKDGKTHSFDLSKLGLPVNLILFGSKSHSDAMEMIKEYTTKTGIPILDERDRDFSIKTTISKK